MYQPILRHSRRINNKMKQKKVRLTITVSPDVLRDFKNKCEKEKRCVSKMIDSFMTYDVKSQISTDKILCLI